MPEAIISAESTEAPTVRSGRFTKDIDGRYSLRCGRVHESRMDVWIAHDHAKGVIVHKSGKCEPWRINGASVAKGAPFRLKSDWSADHKARVLRGRMG